MKRSFLTCITPIAVVAALVGSGSSICHAEPSTSASVGTDDNTRVRALFRKGVAAFGEGRNEEAANTLKEAWSIRQTYDVAAALAQAEIALTSYRDAAEHLDFCLSHFAPVESEQTLQQIRGAFAEVKTHVAMLRLSVDRDGAQVQVDGRPVGNAPLLAPVFVDPGSRTVAARLGGDNVSQSVEAEAGKEYSVSMKLGAANIAAPAQRDALVESAPSPIPNDDARSVVPVVIGGALFAAGVATAIGFEIAASHRSNDASSLHARTGASGCADGSASASDCSALSDALDAKDRDHNWAAAGFVVAGAALVATPVYWFWPRSRASLSEGARSVRLRAGATTRGGGFLISGQF